MNKLLEIALNEYGTKEMPGAQHNQRIIDYARAVDMKWYDEDEIPWCSVFMNYVAKKAGCEYTKDATARSWLKVGEEVEKPDLGDVVILKRGNSSWQGHVGIFISFDGEYVNLLGGNQGNRVCISQYNINNVLGFRKLKTTA